MAMGRGVRSWVPPRSAKTGSGGCATGAVSVVHCRGDGIRVRLRGIDSMNRDSIRMESANTATGAKALGISDDYRGPKGPLFHQDQILPPKLFPRGGEGGLGPSIVRERARW